MKNNIIKRTFSAIIATAVSLSCTSVMAANPELNYPASYGFLKYNIMEEKAKEVIETYLRTLIPMVKDYTSLSSICVSNEPQFWTNLMADFYQPKWEAYIEEKHGTVEAMNEAYGTDYTSFRKIMTIVKIFRVKSKILHSLH